MRVDGRHLEIALCTSVQRLHITSTCNSAWQLPLAAEAAQTCLGVTRPSGESIPLRASPGSRLAVAPPPLTPPPPRSADRVERVPWAVRLPGTAGHPPPAAPSQTSCSNSGTSRQRGRHRGPGHGRPLRVPPTLNSIIALETDSCDSKNTVSTCGKS